MNIVQLKTLVRNFNMGNKKPTLRFNLVTIRISLFKIEWVSFVYKFGFMTVRDRAVGVMRRRCWRYACFLQWKHSHKQAIHMQSLINLDSLQSKTSKSIIFYAKCPGIMPGKQYT